MQLIWLAVFAAVALVPSSFSLNLSSLQRDIRNSDSAWQAAENRISRLPRTERLRYLGAEFDDEVGFSAPADVSQPLRLPDRWDWRDKDGINYASSVLDQGRCGSCVAFATVGALETQMNITRNTPSSPWAFSTQHLFSCGGGGCESGWSPSSALSYLKSQGIPDESCFPYQSGAVGEDAACSATCKDAENRKVKIVSYTQPTMFFPSDDAVKKALMDGPLVAVMKVYEDFFFYKSGVYKHVSGAMEGGHAVMILGWDDQDKSWIVRNSWGKDWGDNGYFKIARTDASGVGSTTWKMTVSPSDSYVALSGIEDRQAVSGTTSIKVTSNYPGTSHLGWVVKSGGNPVLEGSVALRGEGVIETSFLKDGVYEIQPYADHANGRAFGPSKTLHILNGPLQGKVAFKNVAAQQNISGTLIVEFDVQSTPTPFDRIVFQRKHLSSGETSQKGTTNVASFMKMSWRTQNLANGTYEVKVSGIAGNRKVESDPIIVTVAN